MCFYLTHKCYLTDQSNLFERCSVETAVPSIYGNYLAFKKEIYIYIYSVLVFLHLQEEQLDSVQTATIRIVTSESIERWTNVCMYGVAIFMSFAVNKNT